MDRLTMGRLQSAGIHGNIANPYDVEKGITKFQEVIDWTKQIKEAYIHGDP